MTKKLILSGIILSFLFISMCLFGLPKTILKAAEPDNPDYWVNVNSWFTFANSPDFENTIGDFNYGLNGMTKSVFTINYGAYTYNTNTINNLFYNDGELWYSMQFVESEYGNVTSADVRVYTSQDGWENDEYKYIYINNVREELYNNALSHTSVGIFAFVYNETPSDAKDLIYTIVDIIPHTMQSLTSFQIFGTTLFVIIGSLILVILIFKLTKGGGLF